MPKEIFEVTRERFHLLDRNKYIVQGSWPKEAKVEVCLDSQKLPVKVEKLEIVSAMERFKDPDLMRGEQITITIEMPDQLDEYRKLVIYAASEGKRTVWFSITAAELEKKRDKPQVYFEEEKVQQGMVRLRGWAIAKSPVTIRIYDENKEQLAADIQRTDRVDVDQLYDEIEHPEKTGFFTEVTGVSGKCLYVVFYAGDRKTVKVVPLRKLDVLAKKVDKYAKKGIRYWKSQGGAALAGKVVSKIRTVSTREIPYQKWITRHLPGKAELEKQRRTKFSYSPKISIVVPLYKTPEKYLRRLVESIQQQTYTNWELCLSDGSGDNSPIAGILKEISAKDKRIKIISHDCALQISENTNSAIEAATGDFIAFADHDDELTPHALFECVKAINEKPETLVIYSDEDKMSMDGHKFFQPHFKPDYNPDLLCTVNYICHLFVVSRKVTDKVGMLRKEFDGAQDYDFVFRCVEAVKDEEICHVPKILYHWRCHEDSTAENPESKTYAFDAGRRAVQEHYNRIGVNAEVLDGEFLGLYRTKFVRDYDPLISIIIPNKDHIDDLDLCITSIEEKSTWKNYEILVVENNSEQKDTFVYYEELQRRYNNVRILTWKKEFNYSAINNFGVRHAKGDYLLFLNNDVKIIDPDWLTEMLGICQRREVGAVGAKLIYPDNTIQHAGCVVGMGGIAGNMFVNMPAERTGYLHKASILQDMSCVTAACMMMKKPVFQEAGGFTEELAVAFNDVDLCLKVRSHGHLIVYDPYVKLYHYESKSRGAEDSEEKVRRFQTEIEYMRCHWLDILKKGDPYYNKNLSLTKWNYSLKPLPGMGKKKG